MTDNEVQEAARECYANRPCNFKDTDDQTEREFAARLIENGGYGLTYRLLHATIAIIKQEEGA